MMIARLLLGGLFGLQFLLLGLPVDVAESREPLPLPVWQDEVLVSGVASSSPSALALDSKGTVHALYQKTEGDALHWGTGSEDAWESAEVARVSEQCLLPIPDDHTRRCCRFLFLCNLDYNSISRACR